MAPQVDKELPLAFVEDESEVVGIDAAPHLLPGYDVLEEARNPNPNPNPNLRRPRGGAQLRGGQASA